LRLSGAAERDKAGQNGCGGYRFDMVHFEISNL
jgi:hypothetical protein